MRATAARAVVVLTKPTRQCVHHTALPRAAGCLPPCLPPGFARVQQQLLDAGVASSIVYKEALLDASELQGGKQRNAIPDACSCPSVAHA